MRCRLVVNLDNLEANIQKFLKKIDKDKFLAVIKANAYGAGYKKVYEVAKKNGINWFGVATIKEALNLRKLDSNCNILIFGPVETNKYKMLSKKNIHITVTSFDEVNYILENKIDINVHLALDTGMGRIGFRKEDIEKILSKIKVYGIFSHFSCADTDKNYTLMQKKIFDDIAFKYDIACRHLFNSYATHNISDDKYDLYRIGIMMYGHDNTKQYKPVLSLFARVSFIKKLEEDSYIGYGNTYKAKAGDVVATLSIGYADGLNKLLSNKSYVYFKGKKFKIIGNICMDQCMILADESLKVSDEVEIFGEHITLNELSDICNTITYELMCSFTDRVKRQYIWKEKL